MSKKRGCRSTLKFTITANRNDFHSPGGGAIRLR
jgi:hypothetical protein